MSLSNQTPQQKLDAFGQLLLAFYEAMEGSRKKASPETAALLAAIDDLVNLPVLPEGYFEQFQEKLRG